MLTKIRRRFPYLNYTLYISSRHVMTFSFENFEKNKLLEKSIILHFFLKVWRQSRRINWAWLGPVSPSYSWCHYCFSLIDTFFQTFSFLRRNKYPESVILVVRRLYGVYPRVLPFVSAVFLRLSSATKICTISVIEEG